ncbi:FAD-dependent monooxygenase [Streptomyces sp. WMMB303]|uniref:FAD-dependent monooxygenase n=1 Tax=Streptomyces sp. WMMB303 TaxID=3034154 RepID=UPI0023ECA80C|nr:FAD-dependent monooxygenase [Streptomyces sp. WMMB303]MDF4250003.1 FAD-dependent monooxygenase [Streptomyces sp. WMMB303]
MRSEETAGGSALSADVCVVGGGPGGRALALALTRLGVDVVLLEKRDPARGAGPAFRGESVSPDGVRLLDRLGVWERVRGTAHRVDRLEIRDAGRRVLDLRFADFPYRYRHPAELPQEALLAALAEQTARQPGSCTVLEPATAVGLLLEGPAVTGVWARTPTGTVRVEAPLTVGADGRYSAVRRLSGLQERVRHRPLERDVVWLKLPFPADWDRRVYRVRIAGDSHGLFLPCADGTVRVGLNIPKGGLRELRAGGLDLLCARIGRLAPEAGEAAHGSLRAWSDTALLDIFTAEVPRWSAPGVVLVGDAAHTLSPVLGQGVNHALADADVLAPLAAEALGRDRRARGRALRTALDLFQQRRAPEVRRSRALQLRQERMFALTAPAATALRRAVYRALDASPALRRRVLAPAYFPGRRPAARREQPPTPSEVTPV